jgi:hypothetical protein
MNATTLDMDVLPTDVATLHTIVRELLSLWKLADARTDKFEYKLRDLIRRLYGTKSEKLTSLIQQSPLGRAVSTP